MNSRTPSKYKPPKAQAWPITESKGSWKVHKSPERTSVGRMGGGSTDLDVRSGTALPIGERAKGLIEPIASGEGETSVEPLDKKELASILDDLVR